MWYTESGKEVHFMLTICKNDKNKVIEQIKNKVLDGIVASNSNLVDDIILSMLHEGVLDCLNEGFPDRRRHNSFIPLNFIMTLAIAAKMKVRTSLTDIPYAIQDHRTLAELGYNAFDNNGNGWLTEGTIRHLLGKYNSEDIFNYYNGVVQNHILKKLDIDTNIHILDCTKIAVNFNNNNYENASITIDKSGGKMRGYKLATLRGIYRDTGIIEEVKFGTATTNDLPLSEKILRETSCFSEGDVLIMDRGFISRDMINFLKSERKVDVYIPVRKDMDVAEISIEIANEVDDWIPHPKRKDQMICHVSGIGEYWLCRNKNCGVDLNACVIWHTDSQSYGVIVTTDLTKNAEEIVLMYEMRPEIEEDFRQLKDFWKLEDFKSTKLNVISFHIVCVLFGYLFYQLYLNTDDGQRYIGKCLPVILKNYKVQFLNYLVLYSGEYFAIMSMREFLEFRDECEEEIKEFMLEFFN